jgi:tetratricopeptide (TPR) repeat protein
MGTVRAIVLALSCATTRALLPQASFARARRASLLKSRTSDNGRPERDEVPIHGSANPAGPLPVEIQLRIAKERCRKAEDESQKSVAELELSKLELAHPELALMQVASERAQTEEGFESWRWGKLAEEVQRVSSALKIAAAPLDAAPPSDARAGGLVDGPSSKAAAEAVWKSRSRALSELQYWALRGNRRAEAGLLMAVSQHAGNWIGEAADQLLRQAWGVHADASVNAMMQSARDALKQKDAERALEGFAAAAGRSSDIDEGKGFADAHRWIGLTLDKALGDDRNAQAAFEEALDASPHNYVVMMDLGKLLLKRVAREKAAAAAPDADPQTLAAWIGDAGAAEEKLEKQARLYFKRAKKRERQLEEREEQARLYFERATSLNPALATDVQAVLVPAQ